MIIENLIANKKVRRAFTLALYIGFTVAAYAITAHFMHLEFQDIHFLYAVLIGCVAYLPRHILERKQNKK